jgi:hypothetical protein
VKLSAKFFNWLSNITKALPGLHEFANMAGIKLPDALGEELRSPINPSIPPEVDKVGDVK